jgi:hypothetical protein
VAILLIGAAPSKGFKPWKVAGYDESSSAPLMHNIRGTSFALGSLYFIVAVIEATAGTKWHDIEQPKTRRNTRQMVASKNVRDYIFYGF